MKDKRNLIDTANGPRPLDELIEEVRAGTIFVPLSRNTHPDLLKAALEIHGDILGTFHRPQRGRQNRGH